MSAHDIESGSPWGTSLRTELESSNFGILCLTPENVTAPWLLFEAGALSKVVSVSRVVPYLAGGLTTPNIPTGPLTQFHAKMSDENGTWKMVNTLNSSPSGAGIDQLTLKTSFNRLWPDLAVEIEKLPSIPPGTNTRSDSDKLDEVVDLVRNQKRNFHQQNIHGLRQLKVIGGSVMMSVKQALLPTADMNELDLIAERLYYRMRFWIAEIATERIFYDSSYPWRGVFMHKQTSHRIIYDMVIEEDLNKNIWQPVSDPPFELMIMLPGRVLDKYMVVVEISF